MRHYQFLTYMIAALSKIIRYREWYDSKWNCYLNVFLLYCLRHNDQDWPYFLRGALAVMSFSFCLLAFGYAYNDYCDAVEDRMVGKSNQISLLIRPKQFAILLGLALSGMLIPILLFLATGTFLIVLLSFVMAFLYSNRTLGIKRRNVLGLVVSSVAQRVCPLFLVFFIFEDWSLTTAVTVLWAFLVGLRWIFIHQAADLDNDKKSHTNTFVSHQDNASKLLKQITGIFFGELFCTLVIFIINVRLSWSILIPIAYFFFQLYMLSYWKKLGWKRLILSYDFAPLADFYYLWSGVCLVTALLAKDWMWSICFLPVVYFGFRYIILDFKYLSLKKYAKRGIPVSSEGSSQTP